MVFSVVCRSSAGVGASSADILLLAKTVWPGFPQPRAGMCPLASSRVPCQYKQIRRQEPVGWTLCWLA